MTQPLALIIEDDEKLADIYSLTLQAANFATEIINDGIMALSRLQEIEPSVVILDMHLPNVSGREILRTIRASKDLANTKVIVTTADDRLAEMVRADANLVLLKPVSPDQLRALVQRIVRPSA